VGVISLTRATLAGDFSRVHNENSGMAIPVRNRPGLGIDSAPTEEEAVRGYEVVTSDKRGVGTVVDVKDGYLIVRSGWFRRSCRPIPREFVHAVDEAEMVFVTVPRRVLRDAPRVDRHGSFDTQGAARHFGLAESYVQPPSEGLGDSLPHDPSWGAERDAIAAGMHPSEQRRAEIRKHMRPGEASDHGRTRRSPALFGDRRWSERRVNED
jgi:hypothetical protein